MDRSLITQFRKKVNDHHLVWHMYHNRDGKNQWNIICSAMDWIDVVIDNISVDNLDRKNDNVSSVKMMTFINCIDVLWEAIQQLHRVFNKTTQIPFEGDVSLFSNKMYSTDDNEYFKTIRACFSAHPVNLNDRFGGSKKEKRYASWSGHGFGCGDFSVMLYSNQVGDGTVVLNIFFDELMNFAEKRYKHLQTIMQEIDRQKEEYMTDWRKKVIDRSDNPIDQIDILIAENNLRFSNDYYSNELHVLHKIFGFKVRENQNTKAIKSYRRACLPLIQELYTNIQEMRIAELTSSEITAVSCPHECQYALSKLSDSVYGDRFPHFIDLDVFNEHLCGIVDVYDYECLDELYVVVLAGFYLLTHPKSIY